MSGPDDRLRLALLELRDRARISDPGLGRLRTALSAVVCVGTALPVQLGVGGLLGYPGQVGFATTMFGAVVAMLGSNALIGSDRRTKVRTASFFPVAVAAGVLPATLTSGRTAFQVVGFAGVLFAAVWVRRFGTSWFSYGFMAWMGFFFATFLHATWALVPELLVAAVVSTAWVLLLTTTVLQADPQRVLHSTNAAFFAAGRAVARECVDLLEAPAGATARRRRALRAVTARQSSLTDASLLSEAWSAERGSLPPGWTAGALRRRLIETQQAVERFSGAARGLEGAPPEVVLEAVRVLDGVARRRDSSAVAAAGRLSDLADRVRADGHPSWWPARHVAIGAREFLRLDAAGSDPPDVPEEGGFEAATSLVLGGLSGSPAVARDVRARGRWNPLARASMTTRQGAQVMLAGVLAILLGTLLSPTRYYWAVIAVFVTFTGTGTRTETFLKGGARIAGTLLGLVAAILLAHVTAGHAPAVFATILVCVFFAFYLVKVSYTAMTFFVTVLLGQLYTVLGTFSDSLLAVRLEETVVGAVVGVAVALLFAPLSTRDTFRSARDEVLEAMGALLDGAAAYAGGDRPDLDALVRTLDDKSRRLALVARPLTRPLVVGRASRGTRRRLGLFAAGVAQCRALALALQRRPPEASSDRAADVADAATALATAVRAVGAVDVGETAPEAVEPLARGDLALFGGDTPLHEQEPVVRDLRHLSATLNQLASADADSIRDPVRAG